MLVGKTLNFIYFTANKIYFEKWMPFGVLYKSEALQPLHYNIQTAVNFSEKEIESL